jgi:hypothetical protein
MDFITGLSLSRRNGYVYNAILVVVDRYIKISLYIPVTKKIIATELVEVLL